MAWKQFLKTIFHDGVDEYQEKIGKNQCFAKSVQIFS